MQYGRQLLSTHTILPTRVSADGNPKYKAGGIRLNLATLAAAPVADVTLMDGSIIKANQGRYLRFGQILTMLGVAEVQTVVTAGAATGTFTLTLPASGDDPAQTTIALDITTATAAVVQAALNNLTRISARGAVSVAFAAGAGVNGTYTITFPKAMGNPPQLTSTNNLNAGTITHATTTAGVSTNGEYGPYDSAATDGRQTLTRGEAFILDETWLEFPAGSNGVVPESNIIIGGVFEGGDVWKNRLIITAGAHSLAAGPTIAEFEALFPRVSYVQH